MVNKVVYILVWESPAILRLQVRSWRAVLRGCICAGRRYLAWISTLQCGSER